MNILADFHQADLWWSLQLLADRLGATLYRPYGIEWYDQGYFKLYEHPRKKDPSRWLAKQYLEDTIYDPNYDPDTNLVTGIGMETKSGCIDYPKFNLLTLGQVTNEKVKIPIDIIICSVNENEKYFAKLKEFYPNAKFVRHVGNQLDMNLDSELYPNLLASATAPYEAFQGHKVIYRQEFDLNLFKYRPVYNFNNIYSFQNDLEEDEEAWEMWLGLKHQLRDYNFKSYGVGNVDGKIMPKRDYIKAMQDSTFVFQRKFSEGYGHVVHNAFALGRIMVLNPETYLEGIAAPLLKDGETCLFIEDTLDETIKKIQDLSVSDIRLISSNARQMFTHMVNFDEDFIKVKEFFDNLV